MTHTRRATASQIDACRAQTSGWPAAEMPTTTHRLS